MKANEAPEKIYYAPYGDTRENYPITDNDIEYVRKDVFIEKAVEYIDGLIEFLNGHQLEKERIIEDFKKRMEE